MSVYNALRLCGGCGSVEFAGWCITGLVIKAQNELVRCGAAFITIMGTRRHGQGEGALVPMEM